MAAGATTESYFEWIVELTRAQLLDLVLAVEERLRRLVRDVFRSKQTDWETLIPKKIREAAHAGGGAVHADILDRTTLGQLIEVVLARWPLFEGLIPLSREQFQVKADEFRGWRNFLAHGGAPSSDQKIEIAVIIRQVGERIPIVPDTPRLVGVGASVHAKWRPLGGRSPGMDILGA